MQGRVFVSDTIRPTSAAAVAALAALRAVLLAGSTSRVAESVAREVGIDEVVAEVKPLDSQMMAQLQESGEQVAMVGDGVNDSAALAQADLGSPMEQADVAIRPATSRWCEVTHWRSSMRSG